MKGGAGFQTAEPAMTAAAYWPASALILLTLSLSAAAGQALPPDFVYLHDIDASIVQDMRYASFDNFTGHPLPGYGAPECVLRRDVAQALARVQADLAKANLGLKVYDCYRPARAVAAMARWAKDNSDGEPTKRFFPKLAKQNLFALGYIAAHSAHSAGTAIDLGLLRLPAQAPTPFDPATRYGPCTAPAAERAPDNAIDMGTGFDCFDEKSRTASSAIPPEQKSWRETLGAAMLGHGFRNYFREWWHFSFGTQPAERHDFPLR